jgi:SAM-dependent methyltransferase
VTTPKVSAVPRPYGDLVARQGLSDSHRLMLAQVPDGARVLDVGCATGYVAAELGSRGCRVVGFEYDAHAAEQARAHCERVIVGDIESQECRDELPEGMDAVLFGDVLEHLRDPVAVLADARRLLAPDGRVIVSVPNIGVWHARVAIARGRFDYADSGIFDRTHLRFFTRANAHALARDAGFEVVDERFTRDRLPLQDTAYRLLVGAPSEAAQDGPLAAESTPTVLQRLLELMQRAAIRLRPELFANQFVLTLRRRPG